MKNTSHTLTLAHGGGSPRFPENSVAAIRDGLRHRPDLVELDVRMSREGVIYCYHGSRLVYPVFSLLRFLPFRIIQWLTRANTLEECLAAVAEGGAGAFLDFKQENIDPQRIEELRSLYKIDTVWIASRHIDMLATFKKYLGKNHYTYLFNFNSLRLQHTIDTLAVLGIDAMKLTPWQVTGANVDYANARGIGCAYDRTWYFWGDFPKAPRADLEPVMRWYDDMEKLT